MYPVAVKCLRKSVIGGKAYSAERECFRNQVGVRVSGLVRDANGATGLARPERTNWPGGPIRLEVLYLS